MQIEETPHSVNKLRGVVAVSNLTHSKGVYVSTHSSLMVAAYYFAYRPDSLNGYQLLTVNGQ